MALQNPYMQYRQEQVNSTPPDKLLLMLFDGALRFSRQARKAIEENNMQDAHTALVKVQNIVQELILSLDMDYEIAKSLQALYDYLFRRLVEANLKKDVLIIDEVQGFLAELRNTWAEAAVEARRARCAVVGGVALEG